MQFHFEKIRKALISTPFRVCFVRHATPGTDPGVCFEETREIRKGRSKSVCRKFLLNPIFLTIKKEKIRCGIKRSLKKSVSLAFYLLVFKDEMSKPKTMMSRLFLTLGKEPVKLSVFRTR